MQYHLMHRNSRIELHKVMLNVTPITIAFVFVEHELVGARPLSCASSVGVGTTGTGIKGIVQY